MFYEVFLSVMVIIIILLSVFNGLWVNIFIVMSVGLGLLVYFSFGLV